jgi:hypothetical protein
MKSQKITSLNPNVGSVDNNYVKVREVNPVIDDLGFLYPLYHQPFTGTIDLTRMYTHYTPYTMTTNMDVLASVEKVIFGSALIRFIADGTHTPTFSTMKKLEGAQDWVITENAINVVSFAYDGTDVWYTIDKEAE